MIVKKLNDSVCPDASQLNDEKVYTVYAVLLGERNKFLLEDECIFSFPFFVSETELEILDSKVSAHWSYCSALDTENKFSSRPAMLACKLMLDRFFYQNLVEGNLEAKKHWYSMKELLDLEVR